MQTDHGQTNNDVIRKDMLINLLFRYKQVVWGITYGGFDGLQLMVGWQKKNFRIAYIHGGSFNGQISLRYIFDKKQAIDPNKNINY